MTCGDGGSCLRLPPLGGTSRTGTQPLPPDRLNAVVHYSPYSVYANIGPTYVYVGFIWCPQINTTLEPELSNINVGWPSSTQDVRYEFGDEAPLLRYQQIAPVR